MAAPRIVVLSDVHLGIDHPCTWYQRRLHEPYLTQILRWTIDHAADVRELVLLGDIVDLWTYPADVVPPTFADIVAAHPAILGPDGLLAEALEALDGAVSYVPGNHDMGVSQADLDLIGRAGRSPRLVEDLPYQPVAGVALAHGHHATLFNAPTTGRPWSPLPLGYFVTRIVATRWARDLAPGQTVADLAGQGAPNGIDLAGLGSVVAGVGAASIAAGLVDLVAGTTGVDVDAPITMPDGTRVTLAEARTAHAATWSEWAEAHGGGVAGHGSALRAALADFDGTCLGWFAQQLALEHGCDLVVMGHTHVPVSALDEAMVAYVNTGFDCPSEPDLAREVEPQHATFAVIDVPSRTARVWAAEADGCRPIEAAHARIVVPRTSDYSCYVEVANHGTTGALELVDHGAANGLYVVAPPARIEPGETARFWLQDSLGAAGSAGWATYRDGRGELVELRYACPTLGTNSCSGTEEYATRVRDESWREARTVHWGHPFFVAFDAR